MFSHDFKLVQSAHNDVLVRLFAHVYDVYCSQHVKVERVRLSLGRVRASLGKVRLSIETVLLISKSVRMESVYNAIPAVL